MRNFMLIVASLLMIITVTACGGSSDKTSGSVVSTTSDVVETQSSVPADEAISDSLTQGQENEAQAQDAKSDKKLVVLDFFATWCGPCKAMAPAMEQMEKKYAGKIEFRKIDVDQEPELAPQYNITGVPTIVVLSADGKILDSTVGQQTVDELDKMFSALM